MTHEADSSQIHEWLTEAVRSEASDLHLVVDHPPVLRIHGELRSLDQEPLTDELLRSQLKAVCPEALFKRFETTRDVDFSLELTIDNTPFRFRVNGFIADQNTGACFRLIPSQIPSFESLTRVRISIWLVGELLTRVRYSIKTISISPIGLVFFGSFNRAHPDDLLSN